MAKKDKGLPTFKNLKQFFKASEGGTLPKIQVYVDYGSLSFSVALTAKQKKELEANGVYEDTHQVLEVPVEQFIAFTLKKAGVKAKMAD